MGVTALVDGDVSGELLAGKSAVGPVVLGALALGEGMSVEVVVPTGLCVSAGGSVAAGVGVAVDVGVEVEVEPRIDELELLALAALFVGVFVAFREVLSFGSGALTALRLDVSLLGAASAILATGLGAAVSVLATTAGAGAFDSVRLEAGGIGRVTVPEALML